MDSNNRNTPLTSSPILLKYLRAFEQNRRSRVFAPLAETYRKLGMLDKAIEVCQEGIKHNPGYVIGHLTLAHCYFDLGQKNLAYDLLLPFVEQNRDNVTLQRLFARICYETARKKEALDTYKYLLFINPKDAEAAQYNRELVDGNEEVIKAPTTPHVTAPQQFVVANIPVFDLAEEEIADNWVQMNFAQKIPESADQDWSMVRQEPVAPEEKVAMPTSAVVNAEERVFDLAPMDEEETAEDIEPESPLMTHTLVDLYCSQGLNDKAIEILEKILELNPKDSRTQNRLAELREIVAPKNTVVESDGSSELMGLFDRAVQKPAAPVAGTSDAVKKEKLQKFLGLLKIKSDEFLRAKR